MIGITCPKCKAIISETAVICPICEALRKQEEKGWRNRQAEIRTKLLKDRL